MRYYAESKNRLTKNNTTNIAGKRTQPYYGIMIIELKLESY